MSTVTNATQAPPDVTLVAPAAARGRTRHRVALLVTFVITVWSLLEFINLGVKHTTGPEIYGVLTAVLATGAGIASILLLRSPRPYTILTFAVLALWVVIAIAGLAGVAAHIIGPVAGHGPVDPRPRPIAAPLIFTVFGLVGAGALAVAKRPSIRRVLGSGRE